MSWTMLARVSLLLDNLLMLVFAVYVYAGEYARDIHQAVGSKQGTMSCLLHKANAVPSCLISRCKAAASPQGTQSHSKSQTLVHLQDLSTGQSSTVHNKRYAEHIVSTLYQQSDADKSKQDKLPRKGIGPMDKFLK